MAKAFARGQASRAFRDPLSRTIHDLDHSDDEDRFLLLGQAETGRLVVVSSGYTGGAQLKAAIRWAARV